MPRDRGPRQTITAAAPTPQFNSRVAAAQMMTSPHPTLNRMSKIANDVWQTKAWDAYDTVGEFGFGIQWLANGMSHVAIVAAAPPATPGGKPTVIDPDAAGVTASQKRAVELVASIAGGPTGQGQMMAAFGTHLSIAGMGWLVAQPESAMRPDGSFVDEFADEYKTWEVYSADELRRPPGEPMWPVVEGIRDFPVPVMEVQQSEGGWVRLHPNSLVIKCWRKHPRRGWQPDSPARRCLTILRQIENLTAAIDSAAVSRLTGNGLLLMPSEAKFPKSQRRLLGLDNAPGASAPPTGPSSLPLADDPLFDGDDDGLLPVVEEEDDFVEVFIDATIVPIGDRGAPSAQVPLVVLMPGELVDKVSHLTFNTPFDEQLPTLLDAAIKRLALAMDLPPEILTGMAGVNHWTAWQVDETAVTLHIEPLAEISVAALTEYLHAALESEGLEPLEAMVWYDTSELTEDPDMSPHATEAYNAGKLSETAWFKYLGLDIDMDLADEKEQNKRLLIQLAQASPDVAIAIYQFLGILPADFAAPAAAAAPAPEPAPAAEEPPPPAEGPPPDGPPASAAAEALTAACDIIVHRALERAGGRLRSAAGRKVAGGAAAIACPDPARLYLAIDPTSHADLDSLLAGAWSLVPPVASRYGVAAEHLEANLSAYTRALLATQSEHSHERLAAALGAYAAV